jgi:hypothetical protein
MSFASKLFSKKGYTMIFNFTNNMRFYFYSEPVDMRKGIHSLYHLIKTGVDLDALNGDGFVS